MEAKKSDIRDFYKEGLTEYLIEGDERSLTKAYQKSRELLDDGGTELEIVTLHHNVLQSLNDRDGKWKKIDIDRASQYLEEWIAPFEIKFHSYQAVIKQLHEKNNQLEEEIRQRIKAQKKLIENSAKLIDAQQIAKVGSWEWRFYEEPAFEWSDQMCHIFGMHPRQFDGSYQSFLSHVHPDDREYVENTFKTAVQTKKPFTFEHKIIRNDGETRILFGGGRVITDDDGKVTKIIGSGQDVTDQKEREKELQKYGERLRKLTERVERTREEERIRIAREIHDELGQMLTVLKMDFSIMNGEIKKKVSDEILQYFNAEANKILERINTIIESVHRITTELRPQVLDRLGLVEAIEWQAHEFEKRTDLSVTFNTDLPPNQLNEDQKTTLFRIFQEAMNNVIRHSQATSVFVDLKKMDRHLMMTIKDNGIGITQEQKESSSSFGLIGIHERARFLGGRAEIENKDGTRITIDMPVLEDKN